ncbi:methyltransferase domain-containing protein [Sediminicola arcticus]|jgi:ubiquinone/menaquinone biosynthesis C-methylase UbiE|uniref:Methyltransferase domain-containing protein n=1 Tax=Sediminicola arcticus TaxID=1574308 RepID=A0ABV2SVA4_9FLAO
MINTKFRNTDPEMMDDPNVSQAVLMEVLEDISRVNKLLNGNRITVRAICQLIKETTQEKYTIVDMGCGDGQILREIADFYRKKDIQVHLIGIDLSEKGIQIAKERSKEYPEIQFLRQDILKIKAEALQCDILLCTLTMHHFSNTEIPIFLDQFVKLAKIGVVINDLQRSRLAFYLFKLFSIIFIKTDIGRSDGLTSIKSGFKKDELLGFSIAIPSVYHSVQYRWAFRYLWLIRTNRPPIRK